MGNSAALPDDDTKSLDNYLFYTNQLKSQPNGDTVDGIYNKWFGNFDLLEEHHGYIQYLFPIRLGGMNASSQPLTKHESELFRKDPNIKQRIIKSYRLMLDFYGLVLEDENSGKISRNPITFKERFYNLNTSSHNYLRITRILKCLGVIGLEHFKPYFLNHMIIEMFKYNNLTNAKDSLIRYWLPTLRKEEHLIYFDNLIKELSNGKRIVKRIKNSLDGDGFGDEANEVTWQNIYYDSGFNVDLENDEYFKSKDLIIHQDDPFAHLR
ncbi:hypothetical protein ABK040_009300 [Willaertia magna]